MIDTKYFLKGFKSIKGVGSPAIALGASFIAIGALLKNSSNFLLGVCLGFFPNLRPNRIIVECSLYSEQSGEANGILNFLPRQKVQDTICLSRLLTIQRAFNYNPIWPQVGKKA